MSLNRLLARVPGDAILLLEDIDCVSAGAQGPDTMSRNGVPLPDAQEQMITVSVSGVLGLLDGIGSDDGRIIFATVSGPPTSYTIQRSPPCSHGDAVRRRTTWRRSTPLCCAQAGSPARSRTHSRRARRRPRCSTTSSPAGALPRALAPPLP